MSKYSKMLALNLPSFDVKIKKQDKVYVWDLIRKKYVILTPEEWVRQHFINFLITKKQYPLNLLSNEVEINLNNQKRRCDTVVYDKHLSPVLVIEYKAPSVTIDQAVFDQIMRYNIIMKVKYLIVTNGLQHYCCRLDFTDLQYTYLDDIPTYHEVI